MKPRPLSPHLQQYTLPLTAVISISHRATGVVLTIGTLVGAWLLLCLAVDQAAFEQSQSAMAAPAGRALLWLWIYAFIFHLCHGVRHLLWDVGMGFEREQMTRLGVMELIASVVLWVGVFIASLILR
jgi:succinate dehydrogenase / fumarate reductase cytochrome b subunit